jgi:hypothetical protein
MNDIREWHHHQNVRDKTTYPLAPIFNPDGTLTTRVPVALIGEKEGVPRQALYVERVGELLFAGCDPTATAFARRDIDGLADVLRWLGYGALHCKVPRGTAKFVSKPLIKAGFRCVDDEFSHFFKDLEAK